MTGDPDLAQLQRVTRRRDRLRRAGNVGLAVAIAGLVLANLAVIGGAATGVAPGERIARVDVVGIPLLGRDVAAGAQADSGDVDRDGGTGEGARGSAREGGAAGSSLPTWPDTVPPVGDDPADATTADPSAVAGEPAVPSGAEVPATPPPAPAATPPAPDPAPVPTDSAGQEAPTGPAKRVLDLVNVERAAAGCPALTPDAQLGAVATAHAADMVSRQFFAHTSPDGSTPETRAATAGYSGPVAENIATGYTTAEDVVAGWMTSPGHRANILDCGQRVSGVGHDPGSLPGYAPGTWVQLFGTG